jgi:hypothetical protein
MGVASEQWHTQDFGVCADEEVWPRLRMVSVDPMNAMLAVLAIVSWRGLLINEILSPRRQGAPERRRRGRRRTADR